MWPPAPITIMLMVTKYSTTLNIMKWEDALGTFNPKTGVRESTVMGCSWELLVQWREALNRATPEVGLWLLLAITGDPNSRSGANLFVMDKEGALPLTLRRDQLAEGRLPFQMELERDIVIEFIAWIFAFAPRGPVWDRRWANAYLKLCPLVAKQVRVQRTLSWFCSAAGVAPLDRGLLRNLGVRSIVIAGTISMEGEARGFGPARSDEMEVTIVVESDWPIELNEQSVVGPVIAIRLRKLMLGREKLSPDILKRSLGTIYRLIK